MSFTSEVKTELSSVEVENEVVKKAYAYGFLLFGKSFSARSVSCNSNYSCVIDSFKDTLTQVTGVTASVNRLKSGKYTMRVTSVQDRKTVLHALDHEINEISLRVNHGVFEEEECYGAFLRGVFLSCGSIANPDRNYHLEFVIPHLKLSQDLLKILSDMDLKAKYILRKYSHVIYLKDSESIEDLLTIMGATESSLKIMGIKVKKDVRNKINRQLNFECANMSRSIEAGLAQIEAIEIIEKKQGLDSLTDELKELAILRKDNPDMSLKQLGANLKVPLSRSGVNHRFEKIIEIAEKYK